jgi:MerR family mercuric resistance operon transcriptional regulator
MPPTLRSTSASASDSGRPPTLKIGEVARRAGVRVDTVRFYERRGLLPVVMRAPSGYRYFAPEAVDRIVFVKQAQALGFSLDEMAEILAAIDRGDEPLAAAQVRLEGALTRVDEKIADLQSMRANIARLLEQIVAGQCSEIASAAAKIRRIEEHK